MSEITKDFVYKSFQNEDDGIIADDFGSDRKDVQFAKKLKNKQLNEEDLHEHFELKIISNLIPSPGPSLQWCQENFLSVADACNYIEDVGLPAILKIVGGCSLLGLNKNDKILAFAHGIETRRFCEEYATGRRYTICCESRTFYELNPEKAKRQHVSNFWRFSTNPLGGSQKEGREHLAKEEKKKRLKLLKAKKHGTKYSSKFVAAIGMENDLLVSMPFIISEDVCLSFNIAVGIEGCNLEQWTEYCTAHHRTTRQPSIKHFIQEKELTYEKLYLDLIETEPDHPIDAKNTDSISFYLDHYVIPPPTTEFSFMTSKSDDTRITGQHKGGFEPSSPTTAINSSSRSTSSSTLHSARRPSPMTRDASNNHSRRHHPVMGISAFKTISDKVNPDDINNSGKNLNRVITPTLNSSSPTPKSPNSSKHYSKVVKPHSTSSLTTDDNLAIPRSSSQMRALSPSWTLMSSASSPSHLKMSPTKTKNDFNHDADEGYYTKSDVGVQF